VRVAHIRTTIDRHTGEIIQQKVIGYEEVDEDQYYKPLVEILGKRFMEETGIRKQPEMRAAGCEER